MTHFGLFFIVFLDISFLIFTQQKEKKLPYYLSHFIISILY